MQVSPTIHACENRNQSAFASKHQRHLREFWCIVSHNLREGCPKEAHKKQNEVDG